MFCKDFSRAKVAAWRISHIAFVVALLFLSGCVDYDEEMWLNPDLSGRVAMNISVKEELVRGKTGFEKDMSEDGIRRDVERIPGVKLESFESFRDAGRAVAKLRIAFDSIEKLTRHETGVAGSSPISFLGEVAVHEEGRKIVLERTLRALPAAKAKSMGEDMLAKGLSSLLFSKNYLAYKIHVPGELITANSQHIDGTSRTVEWKFTLAQAMRDPPVMRVEWKKAFRVFPLLAAVGAGVFVLALLIILVMRKRGAPQSGTTFS
jgi:hypothetical protein